MCAYQDYIDNFEFSGISNISSGGSNCGTPQNPGNAYIYNSNMQASVTQGSRYAIYLQARTGRGSRDQGFGVWIDYNQDGDFDDAGEFVYANPSPNTTLNIDSVTIPYSAKTGVTRLRVRCLRNSVVSANQSCVNFNRGETEDYNIDIKALQAPPLTDFEANVTFTCNGQVQFTDLTPNSTTSWLWEFGDGDTSHQQNPTHTYSSSGTYTVKLTARNSHGSKTTTKTNYITVNLGNAPMAPQCTSSTSSSAQGFGITSFDFAGISQTSGDASNGYEDFSCNQGSVTQGLRYRMEFGSTSAPANQSYRAWIDYNGDGVFSNQELVLNQDNSSEADGFVTIPGNSVTNRSLRVRVAAVYYLSAPSGSAFTACASLTNGQMEDYSIKISPNTNPPKSDFEAVAFKSCDGKVEFIDRSTNIPTSWKWDFGDGNTSTVKNPTHTYSASGNYDVSLKVSNAHGSDSTIKTGYVVVDLSKGVKSACTPTTQRHIDDYGIHYVLFNTINNTSSDGQDGYQDFSCSYQTTVDAEQEYAIEIKTGSLNKEDVKVWIDYDNDGSFNNVTELVSTSLNDTLHRDTIKISKASIKYKVLRMRITSDIVGTNLDACDNPTYGQTEDYGILIQGDTNSSNAPAARFTVDSTLNCLGTVQFTDQSTNNPGSWLWDFGDGNSSTLQNPKHTYSANGKYTVKLTVTNSFGADSESKTDYVEKDARHCSGNVGWEELSKLSLRIYPNPSRGIINVEFPNESVKKYDLCLYSIDGQVIYLTSMKVAPSEVKQIRLDNYNSGIYFLEVSGENHYQLSKMILH
jgi:PKD repeat protein